MKVTKAASPLVLAASKALSILPPTPRSISATDIASVDATCNGVDDLKRPLWDTDGVVWEVADKRPKECNDENAKVVDARQPNQVENAAIRIMNICELPSFLDWWDNSKPQEQMSVKSEILSLKQMTMHKILLDRYLTTTKSETLYLPIEEGKWNVTLFFPARWFVWLSGCVSTSWTISKQTTIFPCACDKCYA